MPGDLRLPSNTCPVLHLLHQLRIAWHHRHLLDVDVVTWPEIELIAMRTTDEMKGVLARPIDDVPALNGRRVTTLFYEASTRTRVS